MGPNRDSIALAYSCTVCNIIVRDEHCVHGSLSQSRSLVGCLPLRIRELRATRGRNRNSARQLASKRLPASSLAATITAPHRAAAAVATSRPRDPAAENADLTRSTFRPAHTRDGHAALSAASPSRFRGPRSPLRRTAFSAGSADSAAGYEPRGGAPQRQSQLRELNATRSRELTPQSPRARTPRSPARSPCWRPT